MNKDVRILPSALRQFLATEAAGGIILIAAALLAMLIANSPLGHFYHDVLHNPISPAISEKVGPMSPHLWINDGLMAIFFLLVGLEIKREVVDGQLSNPQDRRLPVLAAAVGMAVPAIIYIAIAGRVPGLETGWAIPAATDIAFAMGVLALLGERVPASLKLFLVTVAIADDMGAVAVIAIFYTGKLNLLALGTAFAILIAMWLLNKAGVRSLVAYGIAFVLLWVAMLQSGVHATIAGVLAAMTIPVIPTPAAPDAEDSPLHRLEHLLDAPVAFFIVPLFGFANAGVDLSGIGLGDLFSPLPLGIALGLFLGKQIGIFSAIWLAARTRFAPAPAGASWQQIYGVCLLCGIGFTMSLFIGSLAFADPFLVDEAKLGTLAGSIMSALLGYAVLRWAPTRTKPVAATAGAAEAEA